MIYSVIVTLQQFLYGHNELFLRIVGALVILISFLMLRKLFVKYIFAYILGVAAKSRTDLNEKLLQAFELPIRTLLVVLGAYLALRYLPLSLNVDLLMSKVLRSFIVILIFWGIYGLAGIHSFMSDEFKEKLNIDSILIPFFSKVSRFIVIALAIGLVAHEWNYDVNGFIAGLGLGGLAFALAAKDALANIFGGIVIIMEKPFSIGDWVFTPSVEGTVEDISFRSTRFRTFAHALVTVPNSTLASEAITNWTRMGKRRLTFNLGLAYGTHRNRLESCVNRIRTMLMEHDEINNELIVVNFEKFSESSLDLLIYCFTNTTAFKEFLAVRQDINFKIMDILEDEDVALAIPNRSIHIENKPGVIL